MLRIGLFRRAQNAAEYAAVRLLSALIGLLPERLAVLLGKTVGRLAWLILPWRRRIASRNIELAMPGQRTPREIARLVRQVFIHIGLTAVESLWMRSRTSRVEIGERFPLEGFDSIEAALAGVRGALLFAPHLGNWELFGAAAAARLGSLNALARPVNNPLVRNYATRLREGFRITVLSTRDGVRPMLKALKTRQPVGILADQHVNRAYVPATFFGRKAATTAVVAALALRVGSPVFFTYSLRDGHTFRHHGYAEGPVKLIQTGDHDADVLTNTQLFNDLIEAAIRRQPEQWLWTHRRWKLADRD